MAFAIDPPDGWWAIRNPTYPQDALFEDSAARRPLDAPKGIDAFWSPLKSDGRLKIRYVLFDQTRWPTPASADNWVRDHTEAIKFSAPGGGPGMSLTGFRSSDAVLHKDFGPTPGPSDLERIKALALNPEVITEEAVYSRRMWLCNTKVDRTFERFTERNLRAFEKSIVGKSVLVGHDKQAAPLARFFAAAVDKVDGVAHLAPKFFMMREGSASAIANIEGGVWPFVSIGYRYDLLECDICLKNYLGPECRHLAGRKEHADGTPYSKDVAEGDRGDFVLMEEDGLVICTANYGKGDVTAVEGSIVWLGAQYGAEVVKWAEDMFGNPHAAKEKMLAGIAGDPSGVFSLGTWSDPGTWAISGAGAKSPPAETATHWPETEDLPRTDASKDWNWNWATSAADIVDAHGWDGLASVCTYVDLDGEYLPDSINGYHLPHGRLMDGELVTDFAGCAAALQQLREDPDSIPDVARAEAHLKAHYLQFVKEYPDGAPAKSDAEGVSNMTEMEQKIKDAEDALAASKTALDEKTALVETATGALAEANDKLTDETKRADQAVKDAAELRQHVGAEVTTYVMALGLGEAMASLAGDKGLDGHSGQALVGLAVDLRTQYDEKMPPRMQTKKGEEKPDPDPDDKDPDGTEISEQQRLDRIRG